MPVEVAQFNDIGTCGARRYGHLFKFERHESIKYQVFCFGEGVIACWRQGRVPGTNGIGHHRRLIGHIQGQVRRERASLEILPT